MEFLLIIRNLRALITLSPLCRRAAEAVDKFCLTNQVDSATRTKAAQYFSYLTDTLGNSTDAEGFALLSEALRVELVCRTAWRALRRVNYLEGNTFDKVSSASLLIYHSYW